MFQRIYTQFKIINSSTTYKVENRNANQIKSRFYTEELQKVKYADIILIEKFIRKKTWIPLKIKLLIMKIFPQRLP